MTFRGPPRNKNFTAEHRTGVACLVGQKQSLDGACVRWNAQKAKPFISNKSRILFLRRRKAAEEPREGTAP